MNPINYLFLTVYGEKCNVVGNERKDMVFTFYLKNILKKHRAPRVEE
jgi:hypothetical protein